MKRQRVKETEHHYRSSALIGGDENGRPFIGRNIMDFLVRGEVGEPLIENKI